MEGDGTMDWEQKYLDGEIDWDHGGPSPVLAELLDRLPRGLWGSGEVLVPGCGLGHDVAMLAAAGLPALGVDLLPTAIGLAREQRGLEPGRFVVGDLFADDWRAGRRFSAVWEHTCLCAMPPEWWPRYVAVMAAILDPGCCLLGVFYTDPEPRDDGLPGPPFGASAERLIEEFGADFELLHHWVPERGFASRLGREWLAVFQRR